MNTNFDIVIVGGGAAGFFTAINIAEKNPKLKIAILKPKKPKITNPYKIKNFNNSESICYFT